MANLIDYVRDYGNLSYVDYPLAELDKFVFNEIAYLSLNLLCDDLNETEQLIQLSDYKQLFEERKDKIEPTFISTEGRIELLHEVLKAERYQDLMLSHFISEYSAEYEKQFAAITFTIEALNYRQVAFRGTDATVIGWKEDFNMTFMSEIPAQRSAKEYLKTILEESDFPVVVSGHSKGGNLALYAAAFVTDTLQDKITQVYCLDAPGLHPAPRQKEGFQAIKNRIIAIQPKDSMIGVMLDKETEPIVIEAQSFGMSQHNMLRWIVEDDHFVEVSGPSILSLAFEDTCRQWIIDLSPRELKIVFDTVFGLFLDNGIETLDEMSLNPSQKFRTLVAGMRDLPSEKRSLVVRSFGHMFSIFTEAASGYVRENLRNDIEEFEKVFYEESSSDSEASSEEAISPKGDWLQSLTSTVKKLTFKETPARLSQSNLETSEVVISSERTSDQQTDLNSEENDVQTLLSTQFELLANFAESLLPSVLKANPQKDQAKSEDVEDTFSENSSELESDSE